MEINEESLMIYFHLKFIFLRLRGILGKKSSLDENISSNFPHEFPLKKKEGKINEKNFDEKAKSEFIKGAKIA